jgi:hypothetical protein
MREIIIVNGVKYDAVTGQPIISSTVNKDTAVESDKIHQNLQKSQTLNRKFVKRPNITDAQAHAIAQFKNRHDYMELRRSSLAERSQLAHADRKSFDGVRGSANRVIAPVSDSVSLSKTIAPAEDKEQITIQTNPVHQRALEKMRQQNAALQNLSPKEIKEIAINQALAQLHSESLEYSKKKKQRGGARQSWFNRRFAGMAAGFAVFALFIGYFTYLNAPALSVKVAAIQSGVDATLPQYAAQGYKLNGLAYFDGEAVNLAYRNGGDSYTVKQSASAWDSVALLENYVAPKWHKNYETYSEKGLTIYKNDRNQAVWINGGKMYTVEGEKLNADEIRKIAGSF